MSCCVTERDNPQIESMADLSLKQECSEDEESVGVEPQTEFVAVKQEWSEDAEESDVDYNLLDAKVEPKIEISVEDHSISLEEGLDNVLGCPWVGCSSYDTSSRSPPLPLGMSATSTLGGSGTSSKYKRSVETSSEHFVANRVSRSVHNSKGDAARIIHKCAKCGKSFTQNGNVTNNVKLSFDKKDEECPVSGKYITLDDFKDNSKIILCEKDQKFEECKTCFNLSNNVTKHFDLQSVAKDHKCSECAICFIEKDNLANPLKIHSGGKDYKCPECGKCFTYRSRLRDHLKIHSGERNHKCEECGECFALQRNLKRHLKRHSVEKDHTCVVCGKGFTYKSHLKDHLKIHSGEKDHACVECGKCFTCKSHLNDHLKIHSGERNHKCVVCGKCFTLQTNLRQHIKGHSGEKYHQCAECGKCFTHGSSLKRHLKLHPDK